MQTVTGKEDLRKNTASEVASALPRQSAADGGKVIVLTAPLTESIDHAGFFIQMALASIPQWLEFVLNKKYPKWREVERNSRSGSHALRAGCAKSQNPPVERPA